MKLSEVFSNPEGDKRADRLWTLYTIALQQEDDHEEAFRWAMKRLSFFEDSLEASEPKPGAPRHSFWGE